MYSTMAVSKHSKASGSIIGTHQQIDRASRHLLKNINPVQSTKFPNTRLILHFEGTNGPDGLKIKSAGIDEPSHFIIPGRDDGKLIQMIRDHHYNLTEALKKDDQVRAAFEAAWLSHAITDGLTPAHHFPLKEIQDELMTEKEFLKVFGVKVKGLMHGRSKKETLKNNWLYWAKGGYMTKHIAFEYGVALTMTSLSEKMVTPLVTAEDLDKTDIDEIFYDAFNKVVALNMYDTFIKYGWNARITRQTYKVLLPEIIRAVTLAWNSACQAANA